jgi:hypothetical protein
MMCLENFIFHFSCSLGLKSLTVHSQGSTTTFEKLCVKFIYKDFHNRLFLKIDYENRFKKKSIFKVWQLDYFNRFCNRF